MSKEKLRIIKFPNGQISTKTYIVGSRIHRNLGPALIGYYPNGKVRKKSFYYKGKLHRKNGAADFFYNEDGELLIKGYYKHGLKHRIGGPAITFFKPFDLSEKKLYKFYINGICYDWEEYNQAIIDFKIKML